MKKLNKSAQIHLTETIAVIFIFFVLILFGAIFYFKFQTGVISDKRVELVNARVIDTATKTLFLPELTCTKGDSTVANCIDMMKARRAQSLFSENEEQHKYFELFSYANITLKQIYPPLPPDESITYLYSKKPVEFTKKKPTFFVVSLKDQEIAKDYHAFGYLLIEVYS